MREKAIAYGSSFGDSPSCEEAKHFISENYKKRAEFMTKMKTMPKDQLMKVLAQWKNEQIEKVETELQLLMTIEDMMKNSDSNFDGYTDKERFAQMLKKSRPDRNMQ